MKTRVVLIPAYEPSETLVDLARTLNESKVETIIVDDGSGESYEKIFKSTSHYATVLTHEKNRGKGQAIKTGLKYIKDKYQMDVVIATLDSDGQHTVKDALRVCDSAYENPACLVLGSRNFSGDVPARSRFGNTMTQFIYRLFTHTHVRDTQTGLRGFTSDLIPFMLNVEGERYEYEMNVLLKCSRNNIVIKEIEIETIYIDNNSASHFNTIKDSFRIYREIIKFAASSFIGFLVDYSMYSILVILTAGMGSALSIPLSNVIARISSSSVNFSINKRFVFKDKGSIVKTAVPYFILVACILVGNTILLSILVNRRLRNATPHINAG